MSVIISGRTFLLEDHPGRARDLIHVALTLCPKRVRDASIVDKDFRKMYGEFEGSTYIPMEQGLWIVNNDALEGFNPIGDREIGIALGFLEPTDLTETPPVGYLKFSALGCCFFEQCVFRIDEGRAKRLALRIGDALGGIECVYELIQLTFPNLLTQGHEPTEEEIFEVWNSYANAVSDQIDEFEKAAKIPRREWSPRFKKIIRIHDKLAKYRGPSWMTGDTIAMTEETTRLGHLFIDDPSVNEDNCLDKYKEWMVDKMIEAFPNDIIKYTHGALTYRSHEV